MNDGIALVIAKPGAEGWKTLISKGPVRFTKQKNKRVRTKFISEIEKGVQKKYEYDCNFWQGDERSRT